MAASYNHSVVLLQNGQLYAFGHNSCCGNTSSIETLEPMLVQFPNQLLVQSVCCSQASTIVQTTNGHWYAFGFATVQREPAYGKPVTVLPMRIDDVFPLVRPNERVQVKKLVATCFSFFLQTMQNDVFCVGNCGCGEMGLGHANDAATWTKHSIGIADVQTGICNSFLLQ